MGYFTGKKTEDLYAISFWSYFGWMLFGPIAYLIAFVVIYGNAYGFEHILEMVNNNGLNSDFMSALVITELVSKVLPIGLGIYFFRKVLKQDLVNFKKNLLKYFLILILACATLLATNDLLTWIYNALKIEGTSANQEYIENIFASDYKPIMFMIAVIVAPFFEELIFRKFLIGYLKGKTKLSNFWIYTISATIFAGIHLLSSPGDLVFFPLYFSLSLIITLAYKYSDDNLYVASGIHFFNNLLSFFSI